MKRRPLAVLMPNRQAIVLVADIVVRSLQVTKPFEDVAKGDGVPPFAFRPSAYVRLADAPAAGANADASYLPRVARSRPSARPVSPIPLRVAKLAVVPRRLLLLAANAKDHLAAGPEAVGQTCSVTSHT